MKDANKLRLEQMPSVCARKQIPLSQVEMLNVPQSELQHYIARVIEDARNSLIVDVQRHLYGVEHEVKVTYEHVPADWWQHFKQRWFPGWLQRWFPVQRRKIQILEKRYRVCPHLRIEPKSRVHEMYLVGPDMSEDLVRYLKMILSANPGQMRQDVVSYVREELTSRGETWWLKTDYD